MSLVNCKVKFLRPQYNNLQEWMKNEDNVYIGRQGVVFINKNRFPKSPSNFANPFKIGSDGSRDEVMTKYKKYIEAKIESNEKLKIELLSMKGKKLGCWCYPEKCHGEILLNLIEKYSS